MRERLNICIINMKRMKEKKIFFSNFIFILIHLVLDALEKGRKSPFTSHTFIVIYIYIPRCILCICPHWSIFTSCFYQLYFAFMNVHSGAKNAIIDYCHVHII